MLIQKIIWSIISVFCLSFVIGYPGWKGYGDFGQFSYPDGDKVFENINEPVEYDDNDELLEFTQYSNGNWGCLGQAAFFDEAGRERKYVIYSLKLFYKLLKTILLL